MRFEWDTANLAHLARHDVGPEEAEQAVGDPHRIGAPAHGGPGGERRAAWIGATVGGRVLFVALTFRLDPAAGTGLVVRVVTCRPAKRRERAVYGAAQKARKR